MIGMKGIEGMRQQLTARLSNSDSDVAGIQCFHSIREKSKIEE